MSTAEELPLPTEAAVREQAAALGIDLVGVCDWHALETVAPEYDKPSQLSRFHRTLLVLVRRYPTGVACSPDEALRQYDMGRTARHLEEATASLAYWLEERDCMAALLSAVLPDLRRQPLGYATPAGQGSLLLRQGAVQSGLGTLGLNQMLLTPQYGPRLFLAGIITDLELEADEAMQDELCPGLEGCGRCAAVCPAQAIPTRAPEGASLRDIRALDTEACTGTCQPYGPQRMVKHLDHIFDSASGEEAARKVRRTETQQLFYHLTVMRQGAYTGCARCELVCPVGEDYPAIEESSVRQADLPRDFAPTIEGGLVQVRSQSLS